MFSLIKFGKMKSILLFYPFFLIQWVLLWLYQRAITRVMLLISKMMFYVI